MTQKVSVLDRKVACMEKSRKFYKKTEEWVEMNKLTLNTSKAELIFLRARQFWFRIYFLQKRRSHNTKKFRYLGIQIDRTPSFDEQLNKTLKKMACAIRSLYLIRHQVPLNASILLLISLVLSQLSFLAIFFQNLSAKKPKTP